MEIKNRKSITDRLNTYDYLAEKDSDFIEITEWTNGEGVDINIGSNNETKFISITYGELEAINYLVNTLKYKKDGKI